MAVSAWWFRSCVVSARLVPIRLCAVWAVNVLQHALTPIGLHRQKQRATFEPTNKQTQ